MNKVKRKKCKPWYNLYCVLHICGVEAYHEN